MRLDIYLHQYKNIKSRTLAARLIKSGAVSISGTIITDASHNIEIGSLDDHIMVAPANISKYVSRAGLKLEGALKHFSVLDTRFNPVDAVCLDIGSSTGGFTDCLLQHGAREVFSVDVGTDQMDATLRQNPRVHLFEQTDIRNFVTTLRDKMPLQQPNISYVVIDVSFISLTHIIPVLNSLILEGVVARDMRGIFLIKPQFEVGAAHINKQGVVTDEQVARAACDAVAAICIQYGFKVFDYIRSDITGGDGNTEYLIGVQSLEN